jgi:hypothetical protein
VQISRAGSAQQKILWQWILTSLLILILVSCQTVLHPMDIASLQAENCRKKRTETRWFSDSARNKAFELVDLRRLYRSSREKSTRWRKFC